MVKLIPLLLILSFISFVESATINMKDADIREFAADIAKISNKSILSVVSSMLISGLPFVQS